MPRDFTNDPRDHRIATDRSSDPQATGVTTENDNQQHAPAQSPEGEGFEYPICARSVRRMTARAVLRGLEIVDLIDDKFASTLEQLITDSTNMELGVRDRQRAAMAIARIRKDMIRNGMHGEFQNIYDQIVQSGSSAVVEEVAVRRSIIILPSNGR